ncbi:MAG: alpha/beta hydrolase [Chitinophagaceae bacterium]|nr:alpha/beta hydrolase [Chitinophagaceae bacterium]
MKLSKQLALSYIRAKFKLLSAISKKKAAEQAFKLFCTPPTRDVKELPPVFNSGEEVRFRFDQYDIVGYRWNKGGHRKVLILHGFESTVINFERYIQPLADKGYEVMAFDAPAHGRSSGRQVTAIIYRDLIKYIHEHYGPVYSYMGHSLGGFALSLALAEIPHDRNYRAVYIAPSSETSTAITNFFNLISLDGKIRGRFENIIETMSGHPVEWFTIRRTMPGVKAEILWLHDEDDMVTPLHDALKIKAENYPNIHFVITKGLGHSRIYRDAGVAKKVIDFL